MAAILSQPQCVELMLQHYNDAIMSAMTSQITGVTIVCQTICSKKILKLRVTSLCERNSPVAGEFHAQRASNAEMFPIDDVIMRLFTRDTPSTNLQPRDNSSEWLAKYDWYSARPIYRGPSPHPPPNNSRKTAIAHPQGRDMGVFHEFEVWPKFYLRNNCIVCNIVLYCTVMYRKSIVLIWNEHLNRRASLYMGDQNMVIIVIIFIIILIHLAIDNLVYILCEQRMFSKYLVISWDTVIVWKNVKKQKIK